MCHKILEKIQRIFINIHSLNINEYIWIFIANIQKYSWIYFENIQKYSSILSPLEYSMIFIDTLTAVDPNVQKSFEDTQTYMSIMFYPGFDPFFSEKARWREPVKEDLEASVVATADHEASARFAKLILVRMESRSTELTQRPCCGH